MSSLVSDELLDQRPRMRPEITVTPARYRGPDPVHLVSDPRTGRCYEFGPREYFLVTRFDGTRSLSDIGDDYSRRFGRVLGAASWVQLLSLLFARDLLVPAAGAPVTVVVPRPPQQARRSDLRRGRLVLAPTASFVGATHRRVRWIFGPWVQVPALAVIATVLVVTVSHADEGARHLSDLVHPGTCALMILGLWVSLSLHELAHGVTACHFGGDAPEMGVLFRPPMVFLYCRTNGAAIATERRARAAVAAAGVWVNLVVLTPVLVWWVSTPDAATRHVLEAALLVGTATGLVNLIPVAPLDGYAVASEAIGCLDLARSSNRCVRDTWSTLLRRPSPTYPPAIRAGYLAYACLRVVVVSAALGAAAWYCLAVLPRPWGPISLAMLLAALLATGTARLTRPAASAPRSTPGESE